MIENEFISENKGSEKTELIAEIDSALSANRTEEAPPPPSKGLNSALLAGKILRRVGTCVVLLAAFASLLQQRQSLGETGQYFAFLIYTAALCGAGLLCGIKIKEDKGARTLLALVVAVIPVHFAQMGSLIFNGLGFRDPSMPAVWTFWQTPDPHMVPIVAGVSILALLPMTFLSFSVLVRSHARALTALAFATGVLLLIPTRDGVWVSIMGAVATLTLGFLNNRVRLHSAFKTLEGRVARLSIAAPVVILIGRQIYLYNFSLTCWGIVLGLIALGLFKAPAAIRSRRYTALLESASVVPATLSCIIVSSDIVRAFAIPSSLEFPIIGVLMSAVAALMASHAIAIRRELAVLSGACAVASTTIQQVIHPGALPSIAALVAGIVVTTVSCLKERKVLLAIGLSGTGFSLLYQVAHALSLYTISPWLTLGSVGIATVVAASYLERNFASLNERFGTLRRDLKGWS